jgi:purine-binding chemotaxis protein CheW
MSYPRSPSSIDWEAVWASLDWGASQDDEDNRRTLAQRAENYARPTDTDEQADEDVLKALVFVRGQERYAIPVAYVMQGLTTPQVTPLPCVAAHFRGVINVRGRILSVLDIRRFWRLPTEDPPGPPKLIVVKAGSLEFAIMADDVLEMVSIPLQEVTPPLTAGVGLDHIQGVSPSGTVIIDVESLSQDRRLKVHEEV